MRIRSGGNVLGWILVLACISDASVWQIRATPSVSWNQGELWYSTWGGWASDNDPVRYRSKIDFPLNNYQGGLQLTLWPPVKLFGLPWQAEVGFLSSFSERRSAAADSDWQYIPRLDGGGMDTSLFSGVVSNSNSWLINVFASVMVTKPVGRDFNLQVGAQYRFINNWYTLKGIHSENPYRDIYNNTIVMQYRVTHHLPGLFIGGVVEESRLKIRARAGWIPLAAAFHRDDHVLRYRLGCANNRGHGYNAALGFRVALPGRFSSMALGLEYDYLRVRTIGHIVDSYYDDNPRTIIDDTTIEPASIPDSINMGCQNVKLYIDFPLR